MNTFYLCGQCANEVANADTSARDFWGVSAEESARRDARIAEMGIVAHVGSDENLGYFTCFVDSEEHTSETAEIFETVD